MEGRQSVSGGDIPREPSACLSGNNGLLAGPQQARAYQHCYRQINQDKALSILSSKDRAKYRDHRTLRLLQTQRNGSALNVPSESAKGRSEVSRLLILTILFGLKVPCVARILFRSACSCQRGSPLPSCPMHPEAGGSKQTQVHW